MIAKPKNLNEEIKSDHERILKTFTSLLDMVREDNDHCLISKILSIVIDNMHFQFGKEYSIAKRAGKPRTTLDDIEKENSWIRTEYEKVKIQFSDQNRPENASMLIGWLIAIAHAHRHQNDEETNIIKYNFFKNT